MTDWALVSVTESWLVLAKHVKCGYPVVGKDGSPVRIADKHGRVYEHAWPGRSRNRPAQVLATQLVPAIAKARQARSNTSPTVDQLVRRSEEIFSAMSRKAAVKAASDCAS